MGARTMVCPTCGRSWAGRDVRFCGACGARLGPPLGSRSRASGRRRRVVAGALTTGLLIAVTAGLVAVVPGDRAPSQPADPRVELGDGPVDAEGDPLTREQAEALRQQVDPARLRCEPRGCEIWRRERAPLSGVTTVADLIVVLEGHQLVAMDPATGAERWTAPVGHLRSVTSDGEQIRSTSGSAMITASPDDDGVFLVTGNEVSFIGLDGNRIWSEQPEPGIAWQATAFPDLLIMHGQQHGKQVRRGGAHRIMALDTTTGQTVWTSLAADVHVVESDVIVLTTADRRLLALDTATGAPTWESNPRLGLWAASVGPWIAHHHESGITLLDRTSGEVAATLTGYLTEAVVEVGDRWVSVITDVTDDPLESSSRLTLIALTPQGEVAWRLPLEADPAWDCCSIVVSDDRLVNVTGGGSRYDIDAATGQVMAVARTPASDRDHTTWRSPDGTTIVRWSESGALDIAVTDGTVTILGDDVWVEILDPLVVASADHVMGVRPMPEE